MSDDAPVTYTRVTNWLIPVLLTACVGVLTWIGTTLFDMSKTLAVVVYKIDDHETRIRELEHARIAKQWRTHDDDDANGG